MFIDSVLNNPRKAFRYFRIALKKRVSKKGVLVFIGADPNGELNILYPGYKNCYVFEANPQRYRALKQKYATKDNVRLFNFAVGDQEGETDFHLSSNNNGASSSMGKRFNEGWLKDSGRKDIKMAETITVPCINLYQFLQEHGIEYIDDYVSDIQGMDLQVLKTLRPMIEEQKIGTIKCEVTKNEHGNIYEDLPDNTEQGFDALLGDNYEKIAKGRGLLTPNQFDPIPETMWEMDVMWCKKQESL